jgi:hypothetical protein
MLRTNLSSRPFYNDRAVRLGIGVAVVAVAALSAFNVAQIVSLNARNQELVERAEAAETLANEWRAKADGIRQTLNAGDVATMQAAAREANALIERRAFSWTDLFNRFEQTLPEDVRIGAVQPQLDPNGRLVIVTTVYSRRIEDLDAFIERLEETGAFRGVASRQDDTEDDGTIRSVIQGFYDPRAAREAAAPAPSSDSEGGAASSGRPAAPGNGSPR